MHVLVYYKASGSACDHIIMQKMISFIGDEIHSAKLCNDVWLPVQSISILYIPNRACGI